MHQGGRGCSRAESRILAPVQRHTSCTLPPYRKQQPSYTLDTRISSRYPPSQAYRIVVSSYNFKESSRWTWLTPIYDMLLGLIAEPLGTWFAQPFLQACVSAVSRAQNRPTTKPAWRIPARKKSSVVTVRGQTLQDAADDSAEVFAQRDNCPEMDRVWQSRPSRTASMSDRSDTATEAPGK